MLELLDTFIGLVTIYLILSLIVTAVGDGITTHLNLKGGVVFKILETALGKEGKDAFIAQAGFIALCREETSLPSRIYQALQKLPLVNFLLPEVRGCFTVGGKLYRAPSTLPTESFTATLLDLVANQHGSGVTPTPVAIDKALQLTPATASAGYLVTLHAFWQQANFDMEAFTARLADYFNRVGDRSYGWYKRDLGHYLFITGLWVALFLNADTLHMFKVLTTDQELRAQFVETALELDKTLPGSLQAGDTSTNIAATPVGQAICSQSNIATENCNNTAVAKTLLPKLLPVVGWDAIEPPLSEFCLNFIRDSCNFNASLLTQTGFFPALFFKVIGIALTAAAISLGAPFWFDLLHKVIQIRGAVRSSAAPASPGTPGQPEEATLMAAPRAKSQATRLQVTATATKRLDEFHAKAFGYDVLNYYWSARLAGLAYDADAMVQEVLGGFGAEGVIITHRDAPHHIDTQCLVARTTQAAFISLRGTEQNLQDWLTDARIKQVVPDAGLEVPGTRVHQGFHEALFKADASGTCGWDVILAHPLVQDILARGLPIWISGHSLGGALAVLFALRLRKEIAAKHHPAVIAAIHTFGQPRVGDPAFAAAVDKAFAQRYFRSVNHRDVVPRVPFPDTPALWEADVHKRAGIPVLHYAHAGRVLYFDDLGQALIDPPIWFRTLDNLSPALDAEGLKQELRMYVGDHSMDKYIALHGALLRS